MTIGVVVGPDPQSGIAYGRLGYGIKLQKLYFLVNTAGFDRRPSITIDHASSHCTVEFGGVILRC